MWVLFLFGLLTLCKPFHVFVDNNADKVDEPENPCPYQQNVDDSKKNLTSLESYDDPKDPSEEP